jgi:hypothetical protein
MARPVLRWVEAVPVATSSILSLKKFADELRPLLRENRAGGALAREAEFNRLALALFVLQREAVPVYRQFCERRKVAETIPHWSGIPALPVSAFKEFEVSSIPSAQRRRVFHSSGTSGLEPSRHFHHAESLAVYEASLLPWFERHFFGGQAVPMKLVFLTPEEAPHSSLVQMFNAVRRHFGSADSVFTGRRQADGSWGLDVEQTLAAITGRQPVGLLGTAFSFVHLLEALQAAGKSVALAKGSRIMETGGYKGRSREMPKAELRALMTRWLGVCDAAIITEYGMSELSSQAYDRVAEEQSRPAGPLVFPPWVRICLISPETGETVAEGKTGLLRVFDLANIWSVMAVQTEDLAVGRDGGFELLGRAAAGPPRGCSLMPSF